MNFGHTAATFQRNHLCHSSWCKGAQFERVLVVIDDEEVRFSQYSYGKYFQYIPYPTNDLANLEEGKESVLDRTRRLFMSVAPVR